MSRPQRYANAAMSDEVVVIKETAEVLADAVVAPGGAVEVGDDGNRITFSKSATEDLD